MRITCLFLIMIVAVGCGGDDGGTSHEGIYSVTTWTRNSMACDAEGPSVATMHDPFFYVKNESLLGIRFVNVKGCMDAAECKTEANDKDTIHIGMFGFEEGNDGDGWKTRSAFAFEVQGQCQGGVTESSLTISETGFRIEQKSFDAVPFPPSTGEDECPDEKVEQAIAGQPCTELEVVTASFHSSY